MPLFNSDLLSVVDTRFYRLFFLFVVLVVDFALQLAFFLLLSIPFFILLLPVLPVFIFLALQPILKHVFSFSVEIFFVNLFFRCPFPLPLMLLL